MLFVLMQSSLAGSTFFYDIVNLLYRKNDPRHSRCVAARRLPPVGRAAFRNNHLLSCPLPIAGVRVRRGRLTRGADDVMPVGFTTQYAALRAARTGQSGRGALRAAHHFRADVARREQEMCHAQEGHGWQQQQHGVAQTVRAPSGRQVIAEEANSQRAKPEA